MTEQQPQSNTYMSRGKRWGISLIVTAALLLLVLGAFYVTVSAHNGGSFKPPEAQHQRLDQDGKPEHQPEGQPQPTAVTDPNAAGQIPAEQQVPAEQQTPAQPTAEPVYE